MARLMKENERLTVTVDEAAAGLRLDRFLADRFEGLSRNRLKGLIKTGAVGRGGETIEDPSIKVKPGERYDLAVPAAAAATPKPQPIPLAVVYEDEDVIVVMKPAGMVVHPAAGNWSGTLVNALLHHCGASLTGVGGVMRPGIVHRLDKDTSGLLVAAKNDAAHASLSRQFSSHAIDRAYLAIVWGAPRPLVGTIAAALVHGGPTSRKMMVARDEETPGAKPAVTHYRVLERFGPPEAPVASLVECQLETGRTHQIRAHLAHIGCPVMGDPVYGGGRRLLGKGRNPGERQAAQAAVARFRRQALHAARLGFRHPVTGAELCFEAEMPADMRSLKRELELL